MKRRVIVLSSLAAGLLSSALSLSPALAQSEPEPPDSGACATAPAGTVVDLDGDGTDELIQQVDSEPQTTVFFTATGDCEWIRSLIVSGSVGSADSFGCFSLANRGAFSVSDWEPVEVRAELTGVRTDTPSTTIEAVRHEWWTLRESEWMRQGGYHYRTDALAEGVDSCLTPELGPNFFDRTELDPCVLPVDRALGTPLYLDPDGQGETAALLPWRIHSFEPWSSSGDDRMTATSVIHELFVRDGTCWTSSSSLGQTHGDSYYDQWGCHVNAAGELSIVRVLDTNYRSGRFSDEADVTVMSIEGGRLEDTDRFRYNQATMREIGTTGCNRDTELAFDIPSAGPAKYPGSAPAVAEHVERCGPVDTGQLMDLRGDGEVEFVGPGNQDATTVFRFGAEEAEECEWSRMVTATGLEGSDDSFGCSFTARGDVFLLDWASTPVEISLDGHRTNSASQVDVLGVAIHPLRDGEFGRPAIVYLPSTAGVADGLDTCLQPAVAAYPGTGPGNLWEREGFCASTTLDLGAGLELDLNDDGLQEMLVPVNVEHHPEGVRIRHALIGEGVQGCLSQVASDANAYYQWGCHVDTSGELSIVVVAGNFHDLARADFVEAIELDIDESGSLVEVRRFPYVHTTMQDIGTTGCDPDTATGFDLPDAAPRQEVAPGEFGRSRVPFEMEPLCVIDTNNGALFPLRTGPGDEFETAAGLRAGSCILRSAGAPTDGWHPVVAAVAATGGPWMVEGWIDEQSVDPASAINTAEAAAARHADFLLDAQKSDAHPAQSHVCKQIADNHFTCQYSRWIFYGAHADCGSYPQPHWKFSSPHRSTILRGADGIWTATEPEHYGLVLDC